MEFSCVGLRPPSVALVEYDDCSREGGFILHRRDPTFGHWVPLFAVSIIDLFTLGNDLAYQNAMESIAIVMGLITLASLEFRNCIVDLLGDNTTSLHWSTTLKFRAGTSSAAALCFVLLGHCKGLEIGLGEFRTGASNSTRIVYLEGVPLYCWDLICRRLTRVIRCHHTCDDCMIYSTHPRSSLRKRNCGRCGVRCKGCWISYKCVRVVISVKLIV